MPTASPHPRAIPRTEESLDAARVRPTAGVSRRGVPRRKMAKKATLMMVQCPSKDHSSVTRPATGSDCNRDAMIGFATANG